MENIFTLTKPLFSITEKVLTCIKRTCDRQEILFFIAGATAREVLLHHVHGRSMGRRTRDIDIAVYVNDWQSFNVLKQAFIEQGATSVKENQHRIIVDGTELDIIPFGEIAQSNKISWPPDYKVIMAVDGFSEAFSHSVTVKLDNNELLKFCSLPGLALLKLFAWRDRGKDNGKDALDLFKIISEYGEIARNAIYEHPVQGDMLNWDIVRMGAFLLGYEMAEISQETSLTELKRMDKARLDDAIFRQQLDDDAERIEQLMADFWHGVESPC